MGKIRKKSIYNLFLDDVRLPIETYKYTKNDVYKNLDWMIVRSYDEFVKVITINYENYDLLPDLISFDHDLADEHYAPRNQWNRYNEWAEEVGFKEKTGYNSAQWLVDFCIDNNIKLPNFLCHSMNPSGHERILGLLNNYKKHEKTNNL